MDMLSSAGEFAWATAARHVLMSSREWRPLEVSPLEAEAVERGRSSSLLLGWKHWLRHATESFAAE